MKNILIFAIFVLLPRTGQAAITVSPSANVEIGEEVLFDAENASGITYSSANVYEWDFGDGYFMKIGEPVPDSYDTGIACVHFFMQPGTFQVRLYVNRNYATPVDTITMNVTGTSPAAGFELWHAPFHSRIGQYLTVKIPSNLNAYRLKVTLTDGASYNQELANRTGLQSEEQVLLQNSSLPAGDYALQVELLDAGSNVLSVIREKFSKAYAGVPKVGIDENNAICINGAPFFPIAPCMLSTNEFDLWEAVVNALNIEGWYPTHTLSTWLDYLDHAAAKELFCAGPARFDASPPMHEERNTKLSDIAGYVTGSRDKTALGMWLWKDEPNLGGRNQRIPPQVLAAWQYKCHELDPQHPVLTQMAGGDYLPSPYLETDVLQNGPYLYQNNAGSFGGKKNFYSEVSGFDIYPLEYRNHVSLVDPNRGVIDLWVNAIDNFIRLNYNLIPTLIWLETQDVSASRNTPGPTPQQLRMECWLALVHGAKCINWFQYFEVLPPENFGVMAEFLELVTALTPVILGPDPTRTVTDNANIRGQRVETMIRETDTDIYIFAIRLTEPESEWVETPEPESISVQFTISNLDPSYAMAFDDFELKRKIYENHIQVSGTRQQFTLSQTPILPGSLIIAGLTNDSQPWAYTFDKGDGHLYHNGLTPCGTVDYTTGNIDVTLIPANSSTIIPGNNNLCASYTPVRAARALSIGSSTFQDNFSREALHIYRIPKSTNERNNQIPSHFVLGQNYPNPFNPSTAISFGLPSQSFVSLKVFDVVGREVATIVSEELPAGYYSRQWNAVNIASGVYFYRLQAHQISGGQVGVFTETKKLVLLR